MMLVTPKTVNSIREIPFLGEMEEILKAQKKKQDTRPPRGGREKQAARRQLTICETGISKLEDRCRHLDREMEQYACDAEKLQELYREKQDVEAQLEQEMARWEELSLQLEE